MQAAQRSLALHALAGTPGDQHALTRHVCVECHDELAAVAQGTPINVDTVPALYNIVRKLRFVSIVERGVEGFHAKIHRAIAVKFHHSPALVAWSKIK